MLDADFPRAALQEIGYFSVASGQKTYNGVAILSRTKASNILTSLPNLDDPHRRVLGATLDDIRVLNFYVPNGESVTSEKYQYKLNWLRSLYSFLKTELKEYSKIIMLGDFNIAPEEIDVHDPKLWEGQVLFSDKERKAFSEILQLGFTDCFRSLLPAEKAFSWWDYRMNAFKRNMGLRIDHILVNSSFSKNCSKCYIDKIPRSWERPSDHAPVVAEFSL